MQNVVVEIGGTRLEISSQLTAKVEQLAQETATAVETLNAWKEAAQRAQNKFDALFAASKKDKEEIERLQKRVGDLSEAVEAVPVFLTPTGAKLAVACTDAIMGDINPPPQEEQFVRETIARYVSRYLAHGQETQDKVAKLSEELSGMRNAAHQARIATFKQVSALIAAHLEKDGNVRTAADEAFIKAFDTLVDLNQPVTEEIGFAEVAQDVAV